jgi:hypothetical protein
MLVLRESPAQYAPFGLLAGQVKVPVVWSLRTCQYLKLKNRSKVYRQCGNLRDGDSSRGGDDDSSVLHFDFGSSSRCGCWGRLYLGVDGSERLMF